MHRKLIPKVKKVTQLRSESALKAIVESADSIMEVNDPSLLNARQLSAKSGYSIGTLYYYLNKAEDAFILMIIKRREKQFSELSTIINQFPPDKPIRELVETIINSSFTEYNRMNQKSFFLVFRMILKFSKNPLAFDDALINLVEPLVRAQNRNTTNTFRTVDSDELLMLLKTCFAMIRRPFLEQNQLAGSAKHRELAIDTMVRLLGNIQPEKEIANE